VIPVILTVSKYVPEGMYGFLEGQGERAFFHLSEFDPRGGPPPIIGEEVEAERLDPNGDKSPRARSVVRLHPPIRLVGEVTRFDYNVGYGFVTSEERQFFLHRSDLANGALPALGMMVEFYASQETSDAKRPRACHVRIMDRGAR